MNNWIIVSGLIVFTLGYLVFVYKHFENKNNDK